MNKGFYLLYEGGEACGKSTHAKVMAQTLTDLGHDVVLTKEPGGTPVGNEIRNLLLNKELHKDLTPKGEMLLFFADREQHMQQVIIPALEAGKVVISDRGFISTYAYQVYGDEMELNVLFSDLLWETVRINGIYPNGIIILNVAPEEAVGRITKRGPATVYEEKPIEYHKRLREGFEHFTKFYNESPYLKINTDKPFEEVFKEELETVKKWINR